MEIKKIVITEGKTIKKAQNYFKSEITFEGTLNEKDDFEYCTNVLRDIAKKLLERD